MDSLRTKLYLNVKYMRLPKEKFILHVCLTFRHHCTSRPRFGRDTTPYNGRIKRLQQLPSLKPLHRINLSHNTLFPQTLSPHGELQLCPFFLDFPTPKGSETSILT